MMLLNHLTLKIVDLKIKVSFSNDSSDHPFIYNTCNSPPFDVGSICLVAEESCQLAAATPV